jgi:hypothetical protein
MKKGACTLPIRPPQVKEEEKTKKKTKKNSRIKF